MDVSPADVTGVRIRYRLGTAAFTVRPLPAAAPQTARGVLYPVRVAGVGTVQPPNGHLGGEDAMLG